jgi:hypothetical protein
VRFAAITLCVASQRVFIVVSVVCYRFSPETFGYTLTYVSHSSLSQCRQLGTGLPEQEAGVLTATLSVRMDKICV